MSYDGRGSLEHSLIKKCFQYKTGPFLRLKVANTIGVVLPSICFKPEAKKPKLKECILHINPQSGFNEIYSRLGFHVTLWFSGIKVRCHIPWYAMKFDGWV